jgi:mannose-6-phosphate isomerase-like protein (cupin superfamily)
VCPVTHTREDESYYVTSGELEVVVGDKAFVLKADDSREGRLAEETEIVRMDPPLFTDAA